MMKRWFRLTSVLCLYFLGSLPLVAGTAPPRVLPSQTEEILPGPVPETTPASSETKAVFTGSSAPPQLAGEAVAATVDLRKIPVDQDIDIPGIVMSHTQGSFIGDVSGSNAGETQTARQTENGSVTPSEGNAAGERYAEYVTSWQGQSSTGWIPPDTQIAVGPEYIVEAVNSGFTVYTKTGTVTRAYTSFNSIVNLPSTWDGYLYDPRAIYDAEDHKYIMLILGRDATNLRSYYWILVSQDLDPNGIWYSMRWDVSRGSSGSEEWLDFASLGVDHWGIYISGNFFLFNGGFTSAALWSRNKDLLNGSGGAGLYWSDVRWPDTSHAFSITQALPHSQNGDSKTFFTATHSGAGSEICLWTLTGPRYAGQPDLGTTTNLNSVATTITSYIAVGDVDQPGSDTDIDGGDSRVGNAVYSNGTVYATLAYDPDGDGSHSNVYIVALNVSDGSKLWDYTLFHSDYYYFYPSLTVEGGLVGPNWMIGSAVTSPPNTRYAGGIFYVRDVAANDGIMLYHHMGEGSYVVLDSNNRNRWGDYSSTVWDWSCNNGWTAQEYATDSNSWSTWIGARVLGTEDPCRYFHVSHPNDGQTLIAGNTYTVSWESMNIPADEDVYVYFDDGSSNTQQSGALDETATSWSWVVPNTATNDGKINVRAWDGSSWTTSDYSDEAFTIDACTLDTWEPNNSTAQATSIAPGNSLSNTICVSTDVDYFTFTLTSASSVILETSGSTGDTRMWLLADDGSTVIDYDDDGGSNYFSRIERSCGGQRLLPGTYYVKVDAYGNNEHIDDYSLSLSTAPCPDAIFSDDFESGGTTAWSSST